MSMSTVFWDFETFSSIDIERGAFIYAAHESTGVHFMCYAVDDGEVWLRLSRPPTAKKRKKPEDPAARARDLEQLLERCKTDVMMTRACFNHPRLRPMLPEERCVLLADAAINARGV